MQARIIDMFLISLEQKYRTDGLSNSVIVSRINQLRGELSSKAEFTLEYYSNMLKMRESSQTLLDSFT